VAIGAVGRAEKVVLQEIDLPPDLVQIHFLENIEQHVLLLELFLLPVDLQLTEQSDR